MNAWARVLLAACVAAAAIPVPAWGQSGFAWRTDDRVLFTSFADVRALARDFRNLYIATGEGLLIYDAQSRRWQPPITLEDGYPATEGVVGMAIDSVSGSVWLRTTAGLWHRWAFGASRFDVMGALAPAAIAAAASNSGRDAGASLTAFRATLGLDARARRWPLTAIAKDDRPDRFWFGTRGAFVFHFDALRGHPEWLWYGTPARGISAIAVDERGVWFGADGLGPRAGVARASADLQTSELFDPLDGAPGGRVHEILRTDRAVYFAAADGLFARRTDGRWQTLSRDETISLAQRGSALWTGTLRGAVRIDLNGQPTGQAMLLAGRRVNRMHVAGDTLWLATDAGLYWLAPGDSASDALLHRGLPGLTGSGILDVVRVANQDFALTTEGLFVRKGDTWAGPDRTAAFVGLGRLRRLASGDSVLWVTGDHGAVRYAPAGGAPRVFLAPADIPVGPVLDAVEAGDYVWLATPAGALRLRWRQ